MNTAYLIQQIEQLLREQDSIYHNTAVRFGLSDTAMRVLYLVSETDEVLTQQDLCRQNFSAKQTIHTAINGLVKNGFVELIPIPGTRKSFSMGALLISTGKYSRCLTAQSSFGSSSTLKKGRFSSRISSA